PRARRRADDADGRAERTRAPGRAPQAAGVTLAAARGAVAAATARCESRNPVDGLSLSAAWRRKRSLYLLRGREGKGSFFVSFRAKRRIPDQASRNGSQFSQKWSEMALYCWGLR